MLSISRKCSKLICGIQILLKLLIIMIIYALDPPHLCFLDKAGEAKVLEDMFYKVQKKC